MDRDMLNNLMESEVVLIEKKEKKDHNSHALRRYSIAAGTGAATGAGLAKLNNKMADKHNSKKIRRFLLNDKHPKVHAGKVALGGAKAAVAGYGLYRVARHLRNRLRGKSTPHGEV